MNNTMPALVKSAPGRGMDLREIGVPECGRDDVLIRVRKTGVCGTDVHIYQWDTWAERRVHPPFTVGHEFMGEIAAAGSGTQGFQVGEFVSGEGHVTCGHCYYCRTGQGHICQDVKIIGVDRDGCFAHYLALPASNVWRVKPGVPHEAAAIYDPYGNAMHTVMAQAVAGKTVCIVGAGAIGLMAIKIAVAAGALEVLAVEPAVHKRVLARECGAAHVFDPAQSEFLPEFLAATPEGVGCDVVLEMSGSPAGVRSAFELVRAGGEVALLGIPSKDVGLNLAEAIIFKAVTVRGINGRRMFETWYQCERFLLDHKLDLRPLITHELPYKDYQHAFDLLERGEAVKVILNWD
jgi:threonine 3-dehydrogenase